MRSASRAVLALGLFIAFCSRDTEKQEVGPRAVEPRLTNMSVWRPAPPMKTRVVALTPPDCDEVIDDHAAALSILTSQPQCIDDAIDALARFARSDPAAMSDVAATYYVRAQREDRPSDFVRAFAAAEHAVKATPQLAAAHFNRALTLEALGLLDEAIREWATTEKMDRGKWAEEAARHRKGLEAKRAADGAKRWARNHSALGDALARGDRKRVEELIEPFPGPAQRYFEEVLLPNEANAQRSRTFAAALSKRLGDDPLPLEVVRALETATPEKLAILRTAHRIYARARAADDGLGSNARELHEQAAALFRRAGSPLRLPAQVGVARTLALVRPADTIAALEPLEREARERGYHYLVARIHGLRAFCLSVQGAYPAALDDYEAAIATYERLHDVEEIAHMQADSGEIRLKAGQTETAWREIHATLPHLTAVIATRTRQKILGSAGEAAVALDHPAVGLLYLNAVVDLYKQLPKSREELGSALRHRAQIELLLDPKAAQTDLAAARTLGGSPIDPAIQRTFDARMAEVQARALLATNPAGAAQEFTASLRHTLPDLHTFRAALYAQRAEAWQRAGRPDDAENDLAAALSELRREESQVLVHAVRGRHDALWSSYFARFQDTYRLLIRQLIEKGRGQEAFVYSERARATELFDLLVRARVLPTGFRRIDDRADLAHVYASLPRGTFVLQYTVLRDRAYAWIVSRDGMQLVKLDVTLATIQRWSEMLQSGSPRLDAALDAAFDALMAEPLRRIRARNAGADPARLVIVPDGPMHGLPLSALHDSTTNRYLIQVAPVEIAASTTFYLFSLMRDAAWPRGGAPSILLVGDPEFDDRAATAFGMKRLKGAAAEVEEIGRLYPSAFVSSGGQATIADFLARSREATIVHIAAHAIANPHEPTQSVILFARTPGSSGALAAETLTQTFDSHKTRLVVLSACSSAGGLPIGPEGVAPLVRPLIGAGVPAVIGSLWDVNDATAPPLLVSFHRHYRQGKDAAAALQAAQVELLTTRKAGRRPVRQWAAFQVIGHASSPFAPTAKKDKEKPP